MDEAFKENDNASDHIVGDKTPGFEDTHSTTFDSKSLCSRLPLQVTTEDSDSSKFTTSFYGELLNMSSDSKEVQNASDQSKKPMCETLNSQLPHQITVGDLNTENTNICSSRDILEVAGKTTVQISTEQIHDIGCECPLSDSEFVRQISFHEVPEESLVTQKSLKAEEPSATDKCANGIEDVVVATAASIFSDAPAEPSYEDEVSSEDENVLKYFIMLRPTGPTATSLAKVSTALYTGGRQSVKDYCCNTLGFTSTQYRKTFTSQERNALEAGTNWETFDITFLYKLLQRICGLSPPSDKKWADPSPDEVDELEHNLYLIKCERNFLAHEAVTLTLPELQERSNKLKKLLEKVMCKVGEKKNIDYSQDVKNVKMKIDEILNSISKYSLQTYQQELEGLRQNIIKILVVESRSELFPYYLELWSSSLRQVFLVPIDEDNSHRESEIFTNMTIVDINNSILSVEDIFNYRLKNAALPRVLIIEGIAGIGKSFMCKYILHKWASVKADDINLLNVDIIIFIQCHTINSKSLREYLIEELLPNTCSTLRKEDVIPAIQKCCVMFIIDGLDEAGPNARAIIRELNTKFSNSRKLITCRPEFTEEAKNLMSSNNRDTCVFFAKGFNENQRKEYLGKLMSLMKYNVDDYDGTINKLYLKIQELEDHLYALLCLPLTLMMLVSLWLDNDDSLSETTTVTRIHQQTIEMKVKQLAVRTQRRTGESRHISLIERMCKKWLITLSKVAWQTLKHNTHILDEKCTDELMEEAENHNIDPMDALSCFMKCITLQKMFTTSYAWEFFHKTFQEYLTALYLSQNQGMLGKEMAGTLPVDKIMSRPIDHLLNNRTSNSSQSISTSSLASSCSTSHIDKESEASLSPKKYKGKKSGTKGFFNCFRKFFTVKSHRDYGSKGTKVPKRAKRKGIVHYYSTEELEPVADNYCTINEEEETKSDDIYKESPYSFDNEGDKIDKQNMLQFLAAMETSKQDVNSEYVRKIVKEYHHATYTKSWIQWATFLRECHEHPLVCQIIQDILNHTLIEIGFSDPQISENIEAVDYLLRKTKFHPHHVKLWFYKDKSLPEILGIMLCTLMEFSPGTSIDLKCGYALSSDILQCLNKVNKFDNVVLSLSGTIQDENQDNLITLLKYLEDKDNTIKMEVSIDNIKGLENLAHCCRASPLPTSTELKLRVSFVSMEMLTPLCQVLKAYKWIKPFSFVFKDNDLSGKTKEIEQLLINVFNICSIKLSNMELTVEAYAENRLNDYEEMALNIAEEIPCCVIFERAADGDDIILVMEGIKQD